MIAFTFDKMTEVKEDDDFTGPIIEYSAMEVYRELLDEKQGKHDKDDPEGQKKRQKMKDFLMETMNTDQIEKVNLDDLKEKIEGTKLTGNRAKYRHQVGQSATKPVVAKFEVLKLEHAQAGGLAEHKKNKEFGFKCLHYSVSEASKDLQIMILNKSGNEGSVRVTTIDDAAKAGEDFEYTDKVLNFKKGEKQ